MTWRRIGFYYLTFGLLAAYYLGVERQAPAPAPEAPRTQLIDLTLDRIGEMRLMRGPERVVCRHEGARWRVEEPAGARVPADLIGLLVANLVESQAVEVVAEAGGPQEDFGFGEAGDRIELYPRGQHTPITVFLGARNPAGTALYVRLGDSPAVLLVGGIIHYYTERILEEVRASRGTGRPPAGPGVPGRALG
jgi:hypothetical protein